MRRISISLISRKDKHVAQWLAFLILALMFLAVGCKKKPLATTTPLHQAVEAGDIEQVQSLISSGADVDAKDSSGRTALHLVISRGHANVAELLIAKGADLNAKTCSGNTPLHYAASGRRNMTEFLLANGANVNARNNRGQTPLDYALASGRAQVLGVLRRAGLTKEQLAKAGFEIEKQASKLTS